MEAKKSPAFLATITLLGLVAVAGTALSAVKYFEYSRSVATLDNREREARTLLSAPVALTADNVAALGKSLEAYRTAEAAHRAALAGATPFESEYTGVESALGIEIKEFVERWQTAFKSEGFRIIGERPETVAFGFSRYYQTGVNPPAKSLGAVARQMRAIDFLCKALVDARKTKDAAKGGEIRLGLVVREPIELTDARPQYGKDETPAVQDAVLNRPELLRAETIRINFVAHTDVIRRFINAVNASGRPVLIRGVEIKPATKEQLKNPTTPGTTPVPENIPVGLFGDTPAQPEVTPGAAPVAPKSEVVVAEAPVDATITFALLECVKPAPAVEAK